MEASGEATVAFKMSTHVLDLCIVKLPGVSSPNSSVRQFLDLGTYCVSKWSCVLVKQIQNGVLYVTYRDDTAIIIIAELHKYLQAKDTPRVQLASHMSRKQNVKNIDLVVPNYAC